MHHLEETSLNHNRSNEDLHRSVGTAKIIERAMKVNKLSEMIDCIRDMKSYANTIEKDLPNFSNTKHANRQIETNIKQLKTDDFLHLAKQRLHNNSYILLSDLIETKNKSSEHQQSPKSTIKNHEKSLLEKQVTYMKDVIATQPSALEGIYLEALLDPDQWQSNHQLLRTSPMDTLTPKERKRLNKILYKT